jgi:hypothetical protein
MNYWLEGDDSEDDNWLDEFINADPEHIHDCFRHFNMPEDAMGVFKFVGKMETGRSCWEATFDDDVWLEGEVTQLYKVEEHV